MTSTSPRLGLIVPTRSDPFVTDDIANNWTKVDSAVGSAQDGITNLQGTTTSLQDQINGKTPLGHGHSEADVTGLGADISNLQNQINNRTPFGHIHAEGDVTNLASDLANRVLGKYSWARMVVDHGSIGTNSSGQATWTHTFSVAFSAAPEVIATLWGSGGTIVVWINASQGLNLTNAGAPLHMTGAAASATIHYSLMAFGPA